jgi:hypothetical protein
VIKLNTEFCILLVLVILPGFEEPLILKIKGFFKKEKRTKIFFWYQNQLFSPSSLLSYMTVCSYFFSMYYRILLRLPITVLPFSMTNHSLKILSRYSRKNSSYMTVCSYFFFNVLPNLTEIANYSTPFFHD